MKVVWIFGLGYPGVLVYCMVLNTEASAHFSAWSMHFLYSLPCSIHRRQCMEGQEVFFVCRHITRWTSAYVKSTHPTIDSISSEQQIMSPVSMLPTPGSVEWRLSL